MTFEDIEDIAYGIRPGKPWELEAMSKYRAIALDKMRRGLPLDENEKLLVDRLPKDPEDGTVPYNGKKNGAAKPPKFSEQRVPVSPAEWEAPIPFDDVGQLPEFPVDALPATIRDWVLAEAEATQTPVALSAMLALSVLSAILSKRYEAEIRDGWREPLCLFILIALPPGERKSAVFRDATRAIREWEAAQAKASAPRIQAALTQRSIKEKSLKKAVDRAAQSGLPSDAQTAEQLAVEFSEMEIPVAPRIVADDTTPEKLSLLMSEHGGRMAVMSAEGGIFETISGRYSEGVANLDVILKGHAGDELRVDRINRAPIHIRRPALTLALAVQPDVVAGLASKETFRGRGLLARFAYALPSSRLGRRTIAPPAVDGLVADAFERLCADLLGLPENRNNDSEIEPTIIRFSPEAREQIEELATEIEPRLGPGGDLEVIRDWAAKLVGLVARITTLLHIAERLGSSEDCEDCEAKGGLVSPRARDEQKKIGSFLLSHALGAFRVMGADPVASHARTILNYLLRTLTTLTTTKREVQQALRGTFKRVDDIDAPLNLLTEHGYIRVIEQASTSKGGRKPSPLIEVNPMARKEGSK